MKELIRDTTLGHVLRLVTRKRVLPYEEERDPSLWKRYIDTEKSGRMAHHGHVGEEEKDENSNSTDVDSSPERTYDKEEEAEEGNTAGNDESAQRRLRSGRNERLPRNSSDTRVTSGDNSRRNEISGVVVDPEKGRDMSIVTWFSDEDPEVVFPLMLANWNFG